MKNWNPSRIVLWITIVQFFFTLTFYYFSYQKISEGNNYSDATEVSGQIRKEVNHINVEYEKSTENYKHIIDSLNGRLFYTDLLLNKEMYVSRQRKRDLENLLSQRWDTLSTETRLSECDSLRERTQEYVLIQEVKDTLFQNKIAYLTAINTSTQKQLFTCDTVNRRLNDQINVALIHTRQCEETIRKQKRQNRILKIGTGIIAILTVGFAIK